MIAANAAGSEKVNRNGSTKRGRAARDRPVCQRDACGGAVWKRVLRAVEELQSVEPGAQIH
jgi:hypothetical protein